MKKITILLFAVIFIFSGCYSNNSENKNKDIKEQEFIYELPTLPNANTHSDYYSGYDLDCDNYLTSVLVTDDDPHRLDADNDGIGCE